MKKILIFSTAYFPFVGGAEITVKELTDRLGDEIEFDLITARMSMNMSKVERVGKVNVYRLGVGIELVDKLLVPFLGAIKVLRLQKKNHYAAYWCIMASFATGAAFIANWFQKRVPIILTLQEGDSENHINFKRFGLIGFSWRLALRRADILTAISTYLLERGRKLGFRGKGVLIPNGIDIKKFANYTPRSIGKEIVLITTSRLSPKNGVGDIISAMKLLPEEIKLKIAGTGALEPKLKSQVRRLELENRVEFLGFVSQTDLPNLLHAADIFIRPSHSEGQGISFIEAMAASLPVVATPVGGIPDFIKDGETGVFCKPRDTESIAQAVMRLVNDEGLQGRVRTNALNLVREKYDWDLIAEEMKNKVFLSV